MHDRLRGVAVVYHNDIRIELSEVRGSEGTVYSSALFF
jgi:hypothetical protein